MEQTTTKTSCERTRRYRARMTEDDRAKTKERVREPNKRYQQRHRAKMTDEAKEEVKRRDAERHKIRRRRKREEREAQKLQMMRDEAAVENHEKDQHPKSRKGRKKRAKKKDWVYDEDCGWLDAADCELPVSPNAFPRGPDDKICVPDQPPTCV